MKNIPDSIIGFVVILAFMLAFGAAGLIGVRYGVFAGICGFCVALPLSLLMFRSTL